MTKKLTTCDNEAILKTKKHQAFAQCFYLFWSDGLRAVPTNMYFLLNSFSLFIS